MARTTLAETSEIKSRLRIPSGQTDQDAVIDAWREAVEEEILALTGFTFRAGTYTDRITDWQRGQSKLTRLRPILSASVQGRVQGPAEVFAPLVSDIRDPFKGRVVIVGLQDVTYDPRAGSPSGYTAPWTRWREYIWPITQVTYTVDPLGSETNPIPKALTVATIESVAAIMASPAGSGPIQSVSIEKVSESYGQGAKPGLIAPAAMGLLARYLRETAAMVW
jgi:hypothetical protein